MSDVITDYGTIPQAPFYVFATDSYLSDWNKEPLNAGVTCAVVVLPCASEEEAQIVYKNCQNRDEFKNIRISQSPPTASESVTHSLMTKEDAPVWFTPGGIQPADPTYDGYANIETFCASQMFNNSQSRQQEMLRRCAKDPSGEMLRKYAHANASFTREFRDEFEGDSSAINKVKWSELAEECEELIQKTPELSALRKQAAAEMRPPKL